jgi:hypothetical protein
MAAAALAAAASRQHGGSSGVLQAAFRSLKTSTQQWMAWGAQLQKLSQINIRDRPAL